MAQKFSLQLSTQSSSDESIVSSEIELLTNIYDNELVVKEYDDGITLSAHITPRTADVIDQQFVYADVTMELDKQYPLSLPIFKVINSRGLSDAHVTSIRSDVQLMAQERLGTPMMFDLLEHVRDCLTDQNRPCGACPICLTVFEENDSFTRTNCYHYFHVNCFARYVHHLDDDDQPDGIPGQPPVANVSSVFVRCPVCRVSLPDDSSCFHAISDVIIVDTDGTEAPYCPSDVDIKRMREWSCIMEKQRSQGGMIDHSKDPHLVDWNWVPPSSQPVPITIATTMSTSVTVATTTCTNPVVSMVTVLQTTPKPKGRSSANPSHHSNTQHISSHHYHHKKTRHKHYQ